MNLDALNSAMNPVEPVYSNDVFGQIEFDVWYCVLQKGVGKVVYDPDMHKPGQRRTAVKVNIQDLGGNNYSREFIAEIGRDGWAGITLPSIKDLDITDLSTLDKAYVHAEMVAYDTYKKTDGTEGKRTAPKLLAVYKSLEECEAAAQGNTPDSQMDWTAAPKANGNGAAPNDGEKAIALAFLPAIVKSCVRGNGIDSAALESALKGNPILAKHFTLGSAEVAQAMAAALAEPAF